MIRYICGRTEIGEVGCVLGLIQHLNADDVRDMDELLSQPNERRDSFVLICRVGEEIGGAI